MNKFKKFLIGCGVVLLLQSFSVLGNAASMVIEMPGDYDFAGVISHGTDTLTTDGAEEGTATATLAVFSTYIVSTAAGASQDRVIVPNGTIGGQQKRFTLYTDGETAGTVIAPTTETFTDSDTANGTSTLMEDIGDTVTLEWVNSTIGWVIVNGNPINVN